MKWWNQLVAEWYAEDNQQPEEWVRRWAKTKYDVARELEPSSILEIGVRAGYSAFAMLSAVPAARYLGIDAYFDWDWPGNAGAMGHAQRLLAAFPHVTIQHADSHAFKRVEGGPWDLVHIDGDHSLQGCLQDLLLAECSGARFVLVDDTLNPNPVRVAVELYLNMRKKKSRARWIDDGCIGSTLIEVAA